MRYAIRTVNGRSTLIEASVREVFQDRPGEDGENHFRLIEEDEAEEWVRRRREHETGLWIDDEGAVRYAEREA